MAENQEVSAKLGETLGLADRCFKAENSEGYEALAEELEELETLAKKSFETHADYKSLLRKLENAQSVDAGRIEYSQTFDGRRRRILLEV